VPAVIIGGVAASLPDRVRRWVREFAVAASLPDLVPNFDRLVAQARSRR